jgi:hypothetical protein
MNVKMIGIGGLSRTGKDTFAGISKNILAKNGYKSTKIAFADELKREVQIMLRNNGFEIDIDNISAEEKERIRPLLVFWGGQRRRESKDGLYWVNIADEDVNFIYNNMHMDPDKFVFLISDVRFSNEAKWIKETWKGEFIHLRRYLVIDLIYHEHDRYDKLLTKIFDQAPNEEELKQDPIIQEMADQKIEWENKKKFTLAEAIEDPYLQNIVLDTLNATKFFKNSTTTGILSL